MPDNALHTPSSTLDASSAHPSGSASTANRQSPSFSSHPASQAASSGQPNGTSVEPGPRDDASRKPRFRDDDDDEAAADDDDVDFYDEDDPLTRSDMPSDLRPPFHRPTDGRSQDPLLSQKNHNGHSYQAPGRPAAARRKSSMKERDPSFDDKSATRRRYTYAGFFLVVSLISFTIQTETAVYVKKYLGWQKSYAMLYFTHGSWVMLWFLQLAILRVQKWNTPWPTFWRSHYENIRATALMVQFRDVNAPQRFGHVNPWPFLFRITAFVTSALTIAGGSWYVAVSMTSASDLTAIYNCSAFFAYAFSVPLLGEKLRWNKMAAVAVAIAGVLIVAYGDTHPPKHGSKSGGGTGGKSGHPEEDPDNEVDNRPLGNLVIGIGSVLYGFYEVLYKKWACPPEETSPGRSMLFANLFGSCIGAFTLSVLWIPLPFLHWTGLEIWEWPNRKAAGMLVISVFANAIFSGAFLVLISLTSPVLSSVAALLTIFLVALVDQLLPPPLHTELSWAAIFGGILIIIAFAVLSFATYREMDEERKHKEAVDVDSDVEDELDDEVDR